MPRALSAEARAVHAAAHVVDLHDDVLIPTSLYGWDWGRRHAPNPLPGAALFGHVDIPRLLEGGVHSSILGVVASPFWDGPGQVDRILDRLHVKLERHPELALCGSAQGLRSARETGRIGVFGGIEGAHALGGSLEHLERWRTRGLHAVGLAHFTENAACKPMVGWGSDDVTGLTDHGRALVDELQRLRMVVDLAHVNRAGVLEACARAKAPVIVSHTACNRVHHSPRGLSDAELRAVADTGGVIGVIFAVPFIGPGGAAAVARHLDHIRRTVGVEHCAVGSDWEGFVTYPEDLDSADKMPFLTQALLEAGWSAEHIHAAMGGNALRVFADVFGS